MKIQSVSKTTGKPGALLVTIFTLFLLVTCRGTLLVYRWLFTHFLGGIFPCEVKNIISCKVTSIQGENETDIRTLGKT